MLKNPQKGKKSMLPLIKLSDKSLLSKTHSFKINDIIAFNKKGLLIAHRLIYVYPQKNFFVTKGDNNLKADGKIKPSQILGKVEEIEREGQKIRLGHVYLSQSINYLRELNRINIEFNNNGLAYIILKGLPLHLHFSKTPPRRLYFDADILIPKKDLVKASVILKNLGFRRLQLRLFAKSIKNPSQITFIKNTRPFPVAIDVHLEPAIALTKVKSLNRLIPKTSQFTKYLFDNIQEIKVENSVFPILKTDELVLYLMLHFYHHNFNGIHRLELINTVIKKEKINWDNISNLAKKFRFENFIYSVILMHKKYSNTKIPSSFIKEITPSFFPRLSATIIANAINPFNSGGRTEEGIKRFLLLMLLSPVPITRKLEIITNKETLSYILPSINSLLSSSFKKSRKSFSASL